MTRETDVAGLAFPFPSGPRGTVPAEFAVLRDTDPAAGVVLPDGMRIRLVTRYADVRTVLTDPRFSRARAAELPGAGFGRSQRTGLLDLDPPEHAALRAPLDLALGADRVAGWTPWLTAAVEEHVRVPAGLGPPADLVAAFTRPLAAAVACGVTGIDPDRAGALASDLEDLTVGDAAARGLAHDRMSAAVADVVTRRRAAPRDDVASTLTAPGALTDADAATVLFGLLLSAGVGLRNSLARHLFAVLATPGAAAAVVDDPETAIEELLRFYPSGNDGLLRVATGDVELPGSGARIAAGEAVMPLMAAANRDPAVFDDPERLCPARGTNPHLSLSDGPHSCPAGALVRTVTGLVLGLLPAALPGLALAVGADEVRHTSDLLPLGVLALPVTWDPVPAE